MRYAVEYGARGGQGPLVSPVFSSFLVGVVDCYTLCIDICLASLSWREKRIGERPCFCYIPIENARGLDRSQLSFVDKSVSFSSGCTWDDAYRRSTDILAVPAAAESSEPDRRTPQRQIFEYDTLHDGSLRAVVPRPRRQRQRAHITIRVIESMQVDGGW